MMQRVVLAIGLFVLVIGAFALVASGLGGAETVDEITRSYSLADGQELFVRSRNGAITYEVGEGNEVVIRARRENRFSVIPGLSNWINERNRVEFTLDGSGVRAVHTAPVGWLFSSNTRVHFHVQAPEDWQGRITLQSSNGRITARDLHGEARLRTSNGAIVVDRQSGRLDANTSNGRIELSQVEGVVQAVTSNGPIRVDGGTLDQNGRIRTSNGTIELRAKLERGADYEVRTSNGRVILSLIDADVTVDIGTSNGRIDLDAELAVREFGRSRLVGRIGEGSASLNVRTSNGDVSLSAVGEAR